MATVEKELQENLEEAGYRVTRSGWPDLLVSDSEGNSFMVEVKSGGDRVRGNQIKMMQHLSDLGFNVFVASMNDKDDIVKAMDWKSLNIPTSNLEVLLRGVEKEIIIDTLKNNFGNMKQTAIALRVSLRQLRYKMSKLHISKSFK